ncbi:MAG: hypothetical protein ACFFB5_12745 [Promethearchaeota archaeon]
MKKKTQFSLDVDKMSNNYCQEIEKEAKKLVEIATTIKDPSNSYQKELEHVKSLGESIIRICNWNTDPEKQKEFKMMQGLMDVFKNPDKKNAGIKMKNIFEEFEGKSINDEELAEIEDQLQILEGISIPENSPVFTGAQTGKPVEQAESILDELMKFSKIMIHLPEVQNIIIKIDKLAENWYNSEKPDDKIIRL